MAGDAPGWQLATRMVAAHVCREDAAASTRLEAGTKRARAWMHRLLMSAKRDAGRAPRGPAVGRQRSGPRGLAGGTRDAGLGRRHCSSPLDFAVAAFRIPATIASGIRFDAPRTAPYRTIVHSTITHPMKPATDSLWVPPPIMSMKQSASRSQSRTHESTTPAGGGSKSPHMFWAALTGARFGSVGRWWWRRWCFDDLGFGLSRLGCSHLVIPRLESGAHECLLVLVNDDHCCKGKPVDAAHVAGRHRVKPSGVSDDSGNLLRHGDRG